MTVITTGRGGATGGVVPVGMSLAFTCAGRGEVRATGVGAWGWAAVGHGGGGWNLESKSVGNGWHEYPVPGCQATALLYLPYNFSLFWRQIITSAGRPVLDLPAKGEAPGRARAGSRRKQ